MRGFYDAVFGVLAVVEHASEPVVVGIVAVQIDVARIDFSYVYLVNGGNSVFEDGKFVASVKGFYGVEGEGTMGIKHVSIAFHSYASVN